MNAVCFAGDRCPRVNAFGRCWVRIACTVSEQESCRTSIRGHDNFCATPHALDSAVAGVGRRIVAWQYAGRVRLHRRRFALGRVARQHAGAARNSGRISARARCAGTSSGNRAGPGPAGQAGEGFAGGPRQAGIRCKSCPPPQQLVSRNRRLVLKGPRFNRRNANSGAAMPQCARIRLIY